jgi:nicotinamide-nucleotide amidase
VNAIPAADGKLKGRAQKVLSALKAANMTIVTAESCTAGAVAALLAQAEGAGDVLHGGFVTYTKEHKAKALGVSSCLLQEQGAVNAEVVKQLAAGALERSPATLAIAISGVLGPECDRDGNPVGLGEQFGETRHEQLLEQAIRRAFDLVEESVLPLARKHA